jgi:hypothetical protein
MKYLALALLAFSVPAMAQSKVVLTWTSGNTGASALPNCPATSPTSCAKGFILSMDGTVIASESTLGINATTYTQTPLPAVGNHTYSLVMTGFDAVGAAIQSTPATATVNVPAPVVLNAPTGFTVKLQ